MAPNQLIVMTAEQLKEFAADVVRELGRNPTPPENTTPKRLIYGIRGIRDLFSVSHTTAIKYKKTFLAPAIMQVGQKIITDADMALELYKQHTNTMT